MPRIMPITSSPKFNFAGTTAYFNIKESFLCPDGIFFDIENASTYSFQDSDLAKEIEYEISQSKNDLNNIINEIESLDENDDNYQGLVQEKITIENNISESEHSLEVLNEIKSLSGMYLFGKKDISKIKIKDIFDLSTMSESRKAYRESVGFLDEIKRVFLNYNDYDQVEFMLAHKVDSYPSYNLNEYVNKIKEYARKISYNGERGDYSFIFDYSLDSLKSNISYNNHLQSNEVITLKDSDTQYDYNSDDLRQTRTFFHAYTPINDYENFDQREQTLKKAILQLFSSRDEVYDQNFHAEENRIDHVVGHHLNEDKNDYDNHSDQSYNLIANLILNGDQKSFYQAYTLIKSNHFEDPNEKSPIGNYLFPHGKITVPWALDSSNQDRFVYGEENITISIRNMFLKKLAETAPVTYFLDGNYMDNNMNSFTQAAVTTYLKRGSENRYLDTASKFSSFGPSTFAYIFTQLYIAGKLSTIENLGGSSLLEYFDDFVSRKLSFGDAKRIANMIIPYSNVLAQSVRSQEQYNFLNNNFSDIYNIISKSIDKKSEGKDYGFSEERGFQISEEDLENNSEEEKISILKESGNPLDKAEILRRITKNNNSNLLNFCLQRRINQPPILNFSDISDSLFSKINVDGLDNNSKKDLVNYVLEKNNKDIIYDIIKSMSKNEVSLELINNLYLFEKLGLFKGHNEFNNIADLHVLLYYSNLGIKKEDLFRKIINGFNEDGSTNINAFYFFINNVIKLNEKLNYLNFNLNYLLRIFYETYKNDSFKKTEKIENLDFIFIKEAASRGLNFKFNKKMI